MKKSPFPKRLRHTYYNMKSRCYSPNDKAYKYYGVKGITICAEWLNDRNKFFEWALCNGYSDELTIDRIDPSGNYESDNCRWITHKEQQNNRCDNVFIEIEGVKKTMAQWSEETGVAPYVIRDRLMRGEVDLFKEYRHKILIEINGEVRSLNDWAKVSGLGHSTIWDRYHKGWDANDLLMPSRDNTPRIEINGEKHTVTEWAKISGLHRNIIVNRIKYGWKNEDLLLPKGRGNLVEINGESHTVGEWCSIANIDPSTFYTRRSRGMKGEELIAPVIK